MKLPFNPSYSLIRYSLKVAYKALLDIDCIKPHSSIQGPKIYAANHPTTLDPLLVISVLDQHAAALLSGGTFEIPLIGQLLGSAGHIPVFDTKGHEAYQQALEKLKKSENILIFPEGSLSDSNGNLKPFYSGVIRLAVETGAPIIPIGIAHSDVDTFNPQMILHGKNEQARIITHGKYALTFGEPLYINNKSKKSKQKVAESITSLMYMSKQRVIKNQKPIKIFGKFAHRLIKNLYG